jgi:hypothetical protein
MHDPGWDLSKTPLWARMKELNDETARMGKLVTTTRPMGVVKIDNKDLQAAAWQTDVDVQVLVTNPTDKPQTGTFKLPVPAMACKCLHGVAEIEIVERAVKVSLPAYGSSTLAVQ